MATKHASLLLHELTFGVSLGSQMLFVAKWAAAVVRHDQHTTTQHNKDVLHLEETIPYVNGRGSASVPSQTNITGASEFLLSTESTCSMAQVAPIFSLFASCHFSTCS